MEAKSVHVNVASVLNELVEWMIRRLGIVRPKKIKFCHNLQTHMLFQNYDFFSAAEHKRIYFEEKW